MTDNDLEFGSDAPEIRLSRRNILRGLVGGGLAAASTVSVAAPALAQRSKTINLKFGYTSTPSNPVSVGYEAFARLLKEKSNGEVAVTTFCCNQMGNDQELVQSAQSGALTMGTSSNNNLDQFTSKMMVLELPYLLRSREAYQKFWASAGNDIRHEFETKLGLKILMVMDAAGFRSIETASRVIRKPADLKGVKLRAANTPIELATFRAWGANPVPLAYNQVFTAMQQGTVDGEILQPVWYYTDKHYEVAKKICDIRYIMLAHIGFINLRFFNALPLDLQELLLSASQDAENLEWDQAGKDANDANAKLKAMAGIDWFEPTGPELAAWQDQSRPVWDQFAGQIGADLIKKVVALNG